MDFANVAYGLAIIAAGVFILVYGNTLFRFALAAIGFGVGAYGAWWLLDTQSAGVRALVALVAGGILAAAFYFLVKFALYIAGALFGLGIAGLVGGLFTVWGITSSNILVWILAIVGIGCGGFFGPRLGSWILILGTSTAGSYLVVIGIQTIFSSKFTNDSANYADSLAQRLAIVLILVIFSVGALGQNETARLQRRLRRIP